MAKILSLLGLQNMLELRSMLTCDFFGVCFGADSLRRGCNRAAGHGKTPRPQDHNADSHQMERGKGCVGGKSAVHLIALYGCTALHGLYGTILYGCAVHLSRTN